MSALSALPGATMTQQEPAQRPVDVLRLWEVTPLPCRRYKKGTIKKIVVYDFMVGARSLWLSVRCT